MEKVESSDSVEERFKRSIEAYKTSMGDFLKSQRSILDPEITEKEHREIRKTVTTGFVLEENWDLEVSAHEHLCNMVEQEENRNWQNFPEIPNQANLCIYFADEWVYVMGYTGKLGAINIDCGSGNGKSGFSARIKSNSGILEVESLLTVISCAGSGNENSIKLLEELFQRTKETAEGKMKETVSQVMLVSSSYFNDLKSRKVIRECCMKVGFKKIVIVSDHSLAASRIFSNLQRDGGDPQAVSVLVAVVTSIGAVLYIFGCDVNGNEINGVRLLAGAECTKGVLNKDVIACYQRSLAQLPTERRNSVRNYVVLNTSGYSHNDAEKILDEVFRNGEKLTKSENMRGDKLQEVFSLFPRFFRHSICWS